MNWIKLTDDTKFPKDEVLCVNNSGDFLVGYLTTDESGDVLCSSDEVDMYDITHYADLVKP